MDVFSIFQSFSEIGSWDMRQIVKMACYYAKNMHLTLIIKVLDITQQCTIHLIMLNIAKNHNNMQQNKNKIWLFN